MNILLIEPSRAQAQEFIAWLNLTYGDAHVVTVLEKIDVYALSGGKTADSSDVLPELFNYARTFDFTMSRVTPLVFLHENHRTMSAPIGIGLVALYEQDQNNKLALLADVNLHPTDQIWLSLGSVLHQKVTTDHIRKDSQDNAPQTWREIFLESFLHVC